MRSHIALFICLLSVTISAQQAPVPSKAPLPPKAPAAPTAPAPPQPDESGQTINIRLDVSVIDETVQGAARPKSLMVMLVDRALGQTRAAFQDRTIAVDARPTMVDGRIRVNLTIQSDHFRENSEVPRDPTLSWRNSFSLLLENAKPMVALETMDAATQRKMSIEVKATIQK